MKSSLILAVAGASLIAAQSRSDYFPECSLDCLDDATESATDCAIDDAWCWCIQSNYEAIYNAGLVCILSSCDPQVAVDEVLPAAIDFCSAATSAHEATPTATATPSSTEATSMEATPTEASNDEPEPETTATAGPETTSQESTPTSTFATIPTGAAAIAGPMGGAGLFALGAMLAL